MKGSLMQPEIHKNYRHNVYVNLFDGGFFGMAMGFASLVTVVPLFVSNMTSSAILIGLIPAIHAVGWQLPQLFTARSVSRLSRFKSMVMKMTIHERLPFLALGVVALSYPVLGSKIALPLTFGILIWQGLGAGLTATAWQSMIGKIIPSESRGTFLGMQSGAANLLSSGAVITAGFLLDRLGFPSGFAVCFFIASLALTASYIFLSLTRETATVYVEQGPSRTAYGSSLFDIMRRDRNFAWFVVVRILSQLATMSFGFYTVYAVRHLGMSDIEAGLIMGVYTLAQILINPILGWIGDRWNHPAALKIGAVAASLSALVAWLGPSLNWFYLVYILAAVANVSIWIVGMAMTLEFGKESERPAYIGLSNTLVAPTTILAPIFGGWLADFAGYGSTFLVTAIFGLVTFIVLHFLVRDPRRYSPEETAPALAELNVTEE
jgi:MFS family permease